MKSPYNEVHICCKNFLGRNTHELSDCSTKFLYAPKCYSQISSGFASLVLNEQGRSCKEAHEGQSTHGSTDLCLHADRNDLQAGRGRSLHDGKAKETLEGNQRRLRIGSKTRTLVATKRCSSPHRSSPSWRSWTQCFLAEPLVPVRNEGIQMFLSPFSRIAFLLWQLNSLLIG